MTGVRERLARLARLDTSRLGTVRPAAPLAAVPGGTPAVAGVLLGLLAAAEALARTGFAGPDISLTLLLGLGSCAALAVHRAHPVLAALTATAAGGLSLFALGSLTVGGLLTQLAVLYVLGLRGPRPLSVLLALPFVIHAMAGPPDADVPGRAFAVLVATLASTAVGAGLARRARGEALVEDATERAIARTLLEHAARGERARIARELHDVVAHHISMISVQAETARLTTPHLPDAGAKRLLAIGDTAREALTEMRRLLGVLREDSGTSTGRRPQPGLQQLGELVDEAREAARASTRLIVSGEVASLAPGIELTAYRVVQEALTNARRHAPGCAVDVELHYAPQALRVRVRDNGPGPADASSGYGDGDGYGRGYDDGHGHGHGLLGMRERVATVGGELRCGPAPGGGFLVEARLPSRTEVVG